MRQSVAQDVSRRARKYTGHKMAKHFAHVNRNCPFNCHSLPYGGQGHTKLCKSFSLHCMGSHKLSFYIAILPQNSCIMPKLRDFLFVVENLPTPYCRARPRVTFLRRKVLNLYTIINRVCYRVSLFCFFNPNYAICVRGLCCISNVLFPTKDLVYYTDDCEAIETGHSSPRHGEDRLQLLEENWGRNELFRLS